MHSGDRLVCAFTKQREVGQLFKDWPLHVTIVPWFRLGVETDHLVQDLHLVWRDEAAFDVHMGEEDTHFDHQKNRMATTVALPSPFVGLEQQLRDYLHNHDAWIADELAGRRYSYRPHVTVQREGRLGSGDRFRCDQLYVVEQRGGEKAVVGTIALSGSRDKS